MLPDLELIVKMQGLDLRANELRKEIALLPKQIAEIEKALVAHSRKLEADRASLASNLKERKLKDLEIQSQQAKMAKLKDQMTSAKTNEQFRAFQNEIEFCEKEIRKHEDRVVELLEASGPQDIPQQQIVTHVRAVTSLAPDTRLLHLQTRAARVLEGHERPRRARPARLVLRWSRSA